MINYLRIDNINGFTSFDNEFFEDVNIITGVNGAGKTSVLRLAWYVTSANIERVFDECRFDYLEIRTTLFSLRIRPTIKNDIIESVAAEFKSSNGIEKKIEVEYEKFREEIEEINQLSVSEEIDATVMFPTFRRIEGGFTYLNKNTPKNARNEEREMKRPIEYGLKNLSERLGLLGHKFVTSISTVDIKRLLVSSYAEISSHTNQLHAEMAVEIKRIVKKYSKTKRTDRKEGVDLRAISDLVNINEENQARLLAPFNMMGSVISEFFHAKSVKITETIRFGEDNLSALDSDVLSAGEKQFLGFLAYNALLDQGMMFIDEPELSLHVDWQRRLIKTLTSQKPGNQFIMATHSPFIYSLFEDRELHFCSK